MSFLGRLFWDVLADMSIPDVFPYGFTGCLSCADWGPGSYAGAPV